MNETSEHTADFLDAVAQGDAARVEGMLAREPGLASSRGEDGVSALMKALYHGEPALAGLLLERGARSDAFEAAALGDTERLRDALAVDPDVLNACSADGWTPLHLAAFFGRKEIAEYLLDAGADLEAVSRNALGVRPLQSALASGQEEVARILIDRGADVNAGSDEGFAPLHYCAENDLCGIAEYLLRKGANPEARNRDGKRPADLAREHGHHDVAALFRDEA